MQALEVKKIIESKLENVVAYTQGEGCDFQVTVVGEQFKGLRPVQQQQLVYGCLTDYIANGSIHALTIKAYTNEAWADQPQAQTL